MLHYATTFNSTFSYFLMNKRFVTLQQMFIDAQEIYENLHACEKLPKHSLDEVIDANE